ncbi:hypothetical protein [Pseudooceanicola sp. MF1-13]|uniref:hypothetical protein n=1 Tax=Pseudooceanicola sp. MF1-13 TaxID=3379095 RepID=UPI0038929E81
MKILMKALRLLWASPLGLAKVVVVPGVLALILVGLWVWSPRAVGNGDVLVFVAPGLIVIVCIFWAAAAWHRFVLLDGVVGWLPSVPLPALLRFVGFWVGMLVAGLMIGLFIGRVMMGVVGTLPSSMSYIVRLVIGAIMFWALFLRLSPAIVGAALGRPVGLVRAWDLTAPLAGSLGVATVVIYAISEAVSIVTNIFVGSSYMVQFALWGMAWTLVFTLVTSVMTVTYGVAVQRRSLD